MKIFTPYISVNLEKITYVQPIGGHFLKSTGFEGIAHLMNDKMPSGTEMISRSLGSVPQVY